MRANSLSICIPSVKEGGFYCNKNCPYCVSKMTGDGRAHVSGPLFYRNLKKAAKMADNSQVSSIILTGKTEPLLNMQAIKHVCGALQDYPLEIQTNGILLNEDIIERLRDYRVDTIAISVDSYKQLQGLEEKFEMIKSAGITLRLTINLTNDVLYDEHTGSFESILEYAKSFGVDQLSFRRITIPNYAIKTFESEKAQKWILGNVDQVKANEFLKGYTDYLEKSENSHFLYELAFGARLYVVEGVSCTHFEYCIQDSNRGEDIRSLIYYEDGHMSTTWYGSNHGRIF